MAVSYPYSLPAFADLLKISSIVWDIQRNDELSGSGDGRVWQAELAPPLWTGTVTLSDMYNAEAKQIAARIRKLHGAQEALFLYDPLSKYPQADPDGTKLGSASVSVVALGADNASLSLQGLPAGYRLTVGDKIQVGYGGRYAFLEVSETASADGQGITPVFGVFPHLPAGFTAGLGVILLLPACKCLIMPGSHNPGTASGPITSGATFKVIQKK